jgi:signal transduction histidine kinase
LELGFWADPHLRDTINYHLDKNEPVMEMEIDFYNSEGDRRLGLYTAERLQINREVCNLSIFVDITERKDLETEINRLERLNLVGEMAASIGHEIRNPMTSVRGFLQMFEDKYQEDGEFLRLMIEELDRANSIITEFLSLAKDKRVELRSKKLTAIIKNIMPLIKANATMQDKHIELDLKPGPALFLDEKEIRQLILNLVHNGLESMPAGGTITIKTYFDTDNVVLSIQDQGDGVAPEIIDRLGTPFLTTKEDGTGLGLAVCYRIVNRHNAKIDIETSSAGTAFYVRFPKADVNTSKSLLKSGS